MASFYLDHDVSVVVARLLSDAGHDVLTTRQVGQELFGDHQQLLFAALHDRILVSHNWRDYRLLHDAWQLWSTTWERSVLHDGTLIVEQGDPVWLAERIHLLVSGDSAVRGRLYRLQSGQWRAFA